MPDDPGDVAEVHSGLLKFAVEQRLLVESGAGRKADPFTYAVPEDAGEDVLGTPQTLSVLVPITSDYLRGLAVLAFPGTKRNKNGQTREGQL